MKKNGRPAKYRPKNEGIKKDTVSKRRCIGAREYIDCDKIFQPTSRWNFICGECAHYFARTNTGGIVTIRLDRCERFNPRVVDDTYIMTPAEYVIYIFKGVCATAAAIGRHKSVVSRWHNPKEKGGLDGFIPTRMQRKILDVARAQNLDITAEDIIYGRKVKVKFE